MTPETVIKREDVDGAEIVRRLEGCLGYLSGRACACVGDSEKYAKLARMRDAIEACIRDVRNIAPCRLRRTEATGMETKDDK